VNVGIDFVGDPVIFEKKSEEHAGDKKNPAAREPDSLPSRRKKWNVYNVGGGIADIRHEGEENHREKIFKMKSRTEVRPGDDKPYDAYGEEDEVVENAARLPVAGGGNEEFTKGRGGL